MFCGDSFPRNVHGVAFRRVEGHVPICFIIADGRDLLGELHFIACR